MIAVDTNVLVRCFVLDDESPEFTARARDAILGTIERGEQVYVPLVVVCESVWVWRRGPPKASRDVIAAILDTMLQTPEIVVQEAGALARALLRWRNGAADLTDYLILECSLAAGAREVLSFDLDFCRTTSVREP